MTVLLATTSNPTVEPPPAAVICTLRLALVPLPGPRVLGVARFLGVMAEPWS